MNLRKLHRLAREQDMRCAYCSEPFGNYADEANPTLDHVIPKARGGTDVASNLVAACARCNHAKGDMDADAFCALIDAGRLRARRKLTNRPDRIELPKEQRDKLLRANIAAAERQKPPPPRRANPPHSKNKPLKRIYTIVDVRQWDEDRFTRKDPDHV